MSMLKNVVAQFIGLRKMRHQHPDEDFVDEDEDELDR